MNKIKTICVLLFLISFVPKSEAQFQRTLFRILAKTLIKSVLDDDDDKGKTVRENNAKALNPEIDEEQNKRLSHLEAQMFDVNNKLTTHNARITELEEDQASGNFGLGIGFGNIDDEKYQPMTSIATINFDEASVGLYLNVHSFNPPVNTTLEREKLKFSNVVSYARFGSEDGPAYASIGSINTSAFGNNFLFRNYSNDIVYNDRQVGFKAGLNHSVIGAEVMSSDLSQSRLKVGRVNLKPLAFIDDTDMTTGFSTSMVGFSYIYDKHLNGNEIKIQAFDAQIPIVAQVDEDEHTLVNIFGNYAKLNDFGSGRGVGISAEYLRDGIGIGGSYEYRKLGKSFSTRLFDPFYELGRFQNQYSNYENLLTIPQDREEQSIGVECHIKYLHLSGYYVKSIKQDILASDKGFAHIQALIAVPIPMDEHQIKLEIAASLDKRNLDKFGDVKLEKLTNNQNFDSIFSLSGTANFPIGDNFDIFTKYQYRDFFLVTDTNNQLKKISNSVLSVGLSFNFGNSNF